MAGAHKDEKVVIECTNNEIEIAVYHAEYTAISYIQKGQYLFINNFDVHKNDDDVSGIGLRTLRSQILAGSKFEVKFLAAIAKRDDVNKLNGYYTWAAYGYNGRVPQKSILSKYFKTIHDVISSTNGKGLWKEKGDTFNGVFLLTKESKNIKIFLKYLKEKGYVK